MALLYRICNQPCKLERPGHRRIVAAEFQRGSRVSLLGRVRCGGAVRGALVLGRVLVSRSGRMHRVCAVHLRSVMS